MRTRRIRRKHSYETDEAATRIRRQTAAKKGEVDTGAEESRSVTVIETRPWQGMQGDGGVVWGADEARGHRESEETMAGSFEERATTRFRSLPSHRDMAEELNTLKEEVCEMSYRVERLERPCRLKENREVREATNGHGGTVLGGSKRPSMNPASKRKVRFPGRCVRR